MYLTLVDVFVIVVTCVSHDELTLKFRPRRTFFGPNPLMSPKARRVDRDIAT